MFSIKVFKIVKHVYYQSTFNCCRKENMNYLKMTLIDQLGEWENIDEQKQQNKWYQEL